MWSNCQPWLCAACTMQSPMRRKKLTMRCSCPRFSRAATRLRYPDIQKYSDFHTQEITNLHHPRAGLVRARKCP